MDSWILLTSTFQVHYQGPAQIGKLKGTGTFEKVIIGFNVILMVYYDSRRSACLSTGCGQLTSEALTPRK